MRGKRIARPKRRRKKRARGEEIKSDENVRRLGGWRSGESFVVCAEVGGFEILGN